MGMFFGNKDDIPEPMKSFFEHVEQQADRAEMTQDDAEHRVLALIDSLSAKDLETLCMIFHTCLNSPPASTYYLGLARGRLRHEFNLCPAHGIDHAAQLEQIVNNEKKS